MIRSSLFTPCDADAIVAQAAQAKDWPVDLKPHVVKMAAHGCAFTLRADSRIICIAGVVRNHAASGTAWTVMAPGCWGHMGELTRILRNYLDGAEYRRVDMMVRAEFAVGHRWASRLGFKREAVLRHWAPDGGDMVLHARFKGEEYGRT